MIIHICSRLGIKEMGIELPEKGKVRNPISGNYKIGLKELIKKIGNVYRQLSEWGGTAFSGKRRNFDFLVQQAIMDKDETGKSKWNIWSNDPNAINTSQDMKEAFHTTLWRAYRRIVLARAADQRKALAEHIKDGDCISFYGLDHLQPIVSTNVNQPKNVERLVISARNGFALYAKEPIYFNSPIFENFTTLYAEEQWARDVGAGLREGKSPLVAVFVDGSLQTARQARKMAMSADERLGESLMAEWLRDHPPLPPGGKIEEPQVSQLSLSQIFGNEKS